MGRHPKPVPPRKPNPIRNQKPINAPILLRQATTAAATAKTTSRPARRACPNKNCSAPNIEDGVCHNCGTIVDDSNIVSEVQFGESASGAAVVQGSFVSADQGTAKSLGPAFRRAGGSEDRESTIREGRRIMQNLSSQLGIPEPITNSGVQIFKIAAMNNFIQGRRMDMVASVCLYSACRKEKPCRVMLIDFADKVQVNVFKLGWTFKALHNAVTLAKDGIQPVLPEDLIYRFAQRLEFGTQTDKVAEDAVRMVQRMSLDWMVMGRRPSGVCGACLILAARMNNFRRTITEVVYIVKVTTHTIQKRLDEFKVTPSSALTVEEFLNNEFLESSHDPPSFYEKTEEWQKNKKKRKRRRMEGYDDDEDNSGSENGDETNKRQRTAEPASEQPAQSVELRRDADGFAIPPQPVQSHDIPIDPDLIDDVIEDQSGVSFDRLVAQFGDAVNSDEENENDDASSTTSSRTPGRRRGPDNRPINVPEEWQSVEDEMETDISEMISDPNTIYHATRYAQAKRRAAAHMIAAEKSNPSRNINMDVHIGEDEFADDIEVRNCMLAPAEVAKKEKVWVNENKTWLRKQQIKLWQAKQAANGPPKARRNRKKKPRIGEGQTSAASSPAEAAINVMKERAFSKKINYQAIADIFEGIQNLGDRLGSAGTSRVTSRAGSEFNDSASSRASSVVPGSIDGDTTSRLGTPGPSSSPARGSGSIGFLKGPKVRPSRSSKNKLPEPITNPTPREDDEDSDANDYVSPPPPTRAPAPEPEPEEEEEEEELRREMNEDDFEEEDEEDYEDYGGVEAGGIPDDIDEGFGHFRSVEFDDDDDD